MSSSGAFAFPMTPNAFMVMSMLPCRSVTLKIPPAAATGGAENDFHTPDSSSIVNTRLPLPGKGTLEETIERSDAACP